MSGLAEHVSAVTLSAPVDVSHPVRKQRQREAIPCPLCRTTFTDFAKWRVHATRELEQIKDIDELKRLMYRGAWRRFPGEGSIWRYYMKSRQERWAFKFTERLADGSRKRHMRRTGRNGEWWTTRREAEDALADAMTHGIWGEEPEVPPVSKRRAIREARGLSVTAVALLVGVSRKSIRNWESGTNPSGEHARRYARALAGAS